MSSPATPSQSSIKSGTKRRRIAETSGSEIEQELCNYLKKSANTREALEKQLQERSQKTPEDACFENCALRMKALPPQVKSFLQLQISQLFFNAENPNLQVPITPLPTTPQQHITQHITPQQFQPQVTVNITENNNKVDTTQEASHTYSEIPDMICTAMWTAENA